MTSNNPSKPPQGKRRSSRLSITQDKTVPSIQESILEAEKYTMPSSIYFYSRTKRDKNELNYDYPLIRKMDASQYEIREVLNLVLELSGITDTGVRTETLQDLILKSQDMNHFIYSSKRIARLNEIQEICQKQIQFIHDTDIPIEKIQKWIRSWTVRSNISFLAKVNLNTWENFLNSERLYVANIIHYR